MPMQKDPEGAETRFLHDIVDVTNAHVLEIGCGEGRLTWRYAASADKVVGIDLDTVRLATAHRECPPKLQANTGFTLATTNTLPFPSEAFDLAILAWSM